MGGQGLCTVTSFMDFLFLGSRRIKQEIFGPSYASPEEEAGSFRKFNGGSLLD